MRRALFLLWLFIPFLLHAQLAADVFIFGEADAQERGSAAVIDADTIWYAGTANIGPAGSDDVVLTRMLKDHTIAWQQQYGDSRNAFVQNMVRLVEGDLIICGDVRDSVTDDLNAFVMRVNTDGELIWSFEFGETDRSEDFYAVAETGDALVLTGFITADIGSGNDALLLRMNKNGAPLDTLIFGTPFNDYGMSVVDLPGGNILVAGDRQLTDMRYTAWYAKIGADNSIYFNNVFDVPYNSGCKNMHMRSDGLVYLCGESASALDPEFDVMMMFADTNGVVGDINFYPAPGPDAGYDIIADDHGNFHITGFAFDPLSDDDQFVYMIANEDGEILNKSFYGAAGADLGYDIQMDASGEMWLSGFNTVGGDMQFVLVHPDAFVPIHNMTADADSAAVFPRPVHGDFSFTLMPESDVLVYSLTGAQAGVLKCNYSNLYNWPDDMPDGIYFLQYRSGDAIILVKIIAG